MTATPIPRSLALTFYGDLDISIMDTVPPGRYPVKTYLVPPTKRNGAYQFIRDRIAAGEQAFIICPLVDLSETLESVKAATYEYEILKKEVFPNLSVGILHGRMKTKEKAETLHRFLKGDLQILVATPIVEVGIDIPNATIMMVEGAERFGLSSLHQLRGRVGRSDKQSYCLLFTESSSPQVKTRLEALVKYHNGLKLAEIDLEMRGPGQLYGIEQSGLLDFKIATLSDLALVTATRIEAQTIIKRLKSREFTTLRSKLRGEKLISPD
jgi:ATP-dependent DNA helicase RecG